MKNLIVLIFLSLQFAHPVAAATASTLTLSHQELKSYRTVLAGLDAFDQHHELAPQASVLRFQLRQKSNALNTKLEALALQSRGSETSLVVPISSDGKFTLPRNQAAYDDNATLTLNQREGQLYAAADVRSAGIPDNMRRLGDLRLECQVSLAMVKKELNVFLRAAVTMFLSDGNWCQPENGRTKGNLNFTAPAALADATLVSGERRLSLQISSNGKSFFVPIFDISWPNDALIEFQFSTPLSSEQKRARFNAQPIYLLGSMNHWNIANALRQINATNYEVTIALPTGQHEFKIGSQDFRAIDYGGNDEKQTLTMGGHQLLVPDGENMNILIDQAGTFTFKLDVKNPDQPVLTVMRAE